MSAGSCSNEGRPRGSRFGKRAEGPTPPRARRRSPAVQQVRVRPLCAATPAAAAAAEADRLNNLPRPPRPFRPARPSAAVGDGTHVNTRSLARTAAKPKVSAPGTTQPAAAAETTSAAATTAAAASASSPPRDSSAAGMENGKRWLFSRGGPASEKVEAWGSKKIGPRHPSNDPRKVLLASSGETADLSPNVVVMKATASATTAANTGGQESERSGDDDNEGRMGAEAGAVFARAPRAVPLVARATHVAVLESDGRIGGIREMAVDNSSKGGEDVSRSAGAAAIPTAASLWKGESRETVSCSSWLWFWCDVTRRIVLLNTW